MYGEKEVGAFIGYINLFISMGGAAGGMIIGKLYDATGNYVTPFWVCAALLTVMTMIRFIFSSNKYKFSPE